MIKIFSNGLLDTNTYVVWDDFSMEGMIVDCGVEPKAVFDFTKEKGVSIKYVILTHGHFDHAEYVQEYEKMFQNAKTLFMGQNTLLV